MPDSPVRNVIFDFGGVLLRFRPDEIARDFYPDEDSRRLVRSAVFGHPDWLDMDRGTLSEARAAERFAARTGRTTDEMQRLLRHVKDSLAPLPESFALLDALATRGIPLYALSNMPAPTFAFLRERYDCFGAFRGIVISGEIGLIKPEPHIFHHICERYALAAPESVFIDDHEPNVRVAAALGFKTILFTGAERCADELQTLLA